MNRYSKKQVVKIARSLFPEGFTQIKKGRNNWVFEGKEIILTIPKHKRVKDYAIRVNATRFLRNRGIPVAEVLDYSPENRGTPEYLLVRKVKGSHPNLSSLICSERERIHRSAGEVLAAIHSIDCRGYGRLDHNIEGKSDSWEEFLDEFFLESLNRVRQTEWLNLEFGEVLKREYEKKKADLPSLQRPSFLHADFHLGNLLFEDYEVSAILDLDLVSSGDPCWDTGHYCHTFNVDRKKGVHDFRKGYGRLEGLENERLYCLAIWTRKIGTQAIKRPEALKETIPELIKILGVEK